jgi:hypothetical protein
MLIGRPLPTYAIQRRVVIVVYYCEDNETLELLLELLIDIFLETKEEPDNED